MLDVTNEGQITVNRGDSFSLTLYINKGTELVPIRYELAEKDTLYFAVMEPNQKFENALIKKCLTSKDINENKDIVIKFESEDTVNLLPGLYYYEIKLAINNESEINTVVTKTKFIIL